MRTNIFFSTDFVNFRKTLINFNVKSQWYFWRNFSFNFLQCLFLCSSWSFLLLLFVQGIECLSKHRKRWDSIFRCDWLWLCERSETFSIPGKLLIKDSFVCLSVCIVFYTDFNLSRGESKKVYISKEALRLFSLSCLDFP